MSVPGWQGTILAPDATVSNNSKIDGAVIANSFSGGGEIHDFAYQGTIPCFTDGTLIRTVSGDVAVEDLVLSLTHTTHHGGRQGECDGRQPDDARAQRGTGRDFGAGRVDLADRRGEVARRWFGRTALGSGSPSWSASLPFRNGIECHEQIRSGGKYRSLSLAF